MRHRRNVDVGLLKGGLIFNLVIQSIGTIIFFVVSGMRSWGFDRPYRPWFSELDEFKERFEDHREFILGISSTVMIFLWVMFALYLLVLIFNIFALRHVSQVKKGHVELKTGLLYFVGVLALFSNLIGGILILIGISNAKSSLAFSRQPLYRDDWPPRRREPRYRSDYRWEERRRRDDYDYYDDDDYYDDYDDYPPRRSGRY